MLIDFKNMQAEIIPNMRGGEKEVALKAFFDGSNKIMKGKLIPGATIGLHTHETNSETLYILEGNGKVLYEGEYIPLPTGACHYCPKGKSHSLMNDSDADLVFFAIVPEQ